MDYRKATFSALRRYVMIAETVFSSDALLSAGDRAELIRDLTCSPYKLDPIDVDHVCHQTADARLESNMVNAQILRHANH